MPIELLSFDLDDTLWPCLPVILNAEKTLYRWLQENVTTVTDAHSIEGLRVHRQQFMQNHPHLASDLTQLRKASMREISVQLDIDDDWVDMAFSVFHSARQQVILFDDVAPVLDELAERYRLVAVSNGNADINQAGVDHWFEFSVNAEEVGVAKPHPEVFETMLKKAGVNAGDVVHVGDHPEHDILGASQLGINAIWVNRNAEVWPLEGYRADAEIMDFSQLPTILDILADR